MCVHHSLFGNMLVSADSSVERVTIDIQLVEGGFNILVIMLDASIPRPPDVLISEWMKVYMSEKYSFAAAGLKSLIVVPYSALGVEHKKYNSIYDYTFSPYGICSLMNLLAVDQHLAAGSLTITNGKFPGRMISTPMNGGFPSMKDAQAVEPGSRLKAFMDEIVKRRSQ